MISVSFCLFSLSQTEFIKILRNREMAWWSVSKRTWAQFSSANKKPNMVTCVCSPTTAVRDKWVLRASWSASQPSSARDPFLCSKAGIDRGSYSVLLWLSHESLPCKGGFNTGTKGNNGTGKGYNTLLWKVWASQESGQSSWVFM